jgi:hypothetical protein
LNSGGYNFFFTAFSPVPVIPMDEITGETFMAKRAVKRKVKKQNKNEYLGFNLGWVYGAAILFFSFGLMMAYQNCASLGPGMPLP